MVGPAGLGSKAHLPAPLRVVSDGGVAPVQAQPSCALDRREPAVARPPTERAACAPNVTAPVGGATAGPAKGTFSPSVLAVALASEPLGPGHQAVVRDQLNLLIGKYGPVDRDTALGLPRAAHYKVERLLPFNGAHSPNGLLQMSPKSHGEAVRFLTGARDRAAIAGMGSVVHEALHGHSVVGARHWGELPEASQRIDHLAIVAATQAILVREFRVDPGSITTSVPYGVNETIAMIARSTGLSPAAARNALYDASLQYLGPGPNVHTGQMVERRFIDAVSAVTGRRFDDALRQHLAALP
ncbi:MAG: hypothetical protein ACAI38_22925 [Myxococcota bacterium]